MLDPVSNKANKQQNRQVAEILQKGVCMGAWKGFFRRPFKERNE